MDLEGSVKRILEVYSVISPSADPDLSLRYVGKKNGITKPWILSFDSFQIQTETWEEAITKTLLKLKADLETKLKNSEHQIEKYQKTLSKLSD